jgi:hypothetical protein
MRCNKTDIYITRGDTGFFNIEIELDKLFNITDIRFTVKKNLYAAEIISKTNALNGGITQVSKITSPTDNSKDLWTFSIEITPANTETQDVGAFRYDVQIKYEDENDKEYVLTIIKPSIFAIEEDITGP